MVKSRRQRITATFFIPVAVALLGSPVTAHHIPAPYVVEEVPIDIQEAGRTVALDISPTSDAIWLAASESGGLFRTSDSGATWTRIDSLPPHRLYDVAWAPNTPGTILVTAFDDYRFPDSGGIWRSIDGGTNWAQITGAIPGCNASMLGSEVHAREIAFDPANNDVYVTTDCGVAISRNAGASPWIHKGPTLGTANIREHTVTVQTGGIVTLCGDDGLHRSTDAGVTWIWTNAFDPRPAARQTGFVCEQEGTHALSGSPVEADVVYVGVKDLDGATPPKTTIMLYEVVYNTGADTVSSSTRLNTPETNNRSPVVRARNTPFAAPTVYSVFYSNGVDAYVQHCDSAAGRCTATTGSWAQVTLAHTDTSEFAFGSGDCPLAMANDGGVLVTSDCGSTWTWPALDGLDALQLYDVEVQAYDDGMGGHDHTDIYISTMDNGVHASSDTGATWPHRGAGGEGLHIEVPKTPPAHDLQIISYTACADCIGKVSNRHFENVIDWTPPTTGEAARGFPGQLVIEHNSFISVMENKVCSGTTLSCTENSHCLPMVNCVNQDYRIHLLEGIGTSWIDRLTLTRRPRNARTQFSGPLSNPTLFMGVAGTSATNLGLERIDNIRSGVPDINPADNGLSLGMHWQGQGCFDCPKPTFAADPSTPAQLIGVNTDGRIYTSSTSGAPWVDSMGNPQPGWAIDDNSTNTITAGYEQTKCFPNKAGGMRCEPNVRVIEYDPSDPNNVFVGLETGGVFYSDDGGANWEWIPGSDQITAITAFAFDQITEDIFVSSYGRGLWKLRKVDLMIPAPDPYEPNDETFESTDLELDFHRHYDPLVAADRSAVMQSQELWSGALTSLTLHDRNDVDRFRVNIPDIRAHVPDLQDGPTPDPMPICGEITRLTRPRPYYITDEPDLILFSGMIKVTTDLPNDDVLEVVGFPSSGTSQQRLIPCPLLELVPGFDFSVGDRSGLVVERAVFPTYAVRVEYSINITRISAAARWIGDRLAVHRDSERVFPLPCPDGFFPDCPSTLGGVVELELEHPIVPDCTADGPGCRMFHPFWWSKSALFELVFSSAIDQSYELWNEQGQRIAQAVPAPQEGTTFTKVLTAPQLVPGFYVLVITGPDGVFKLTFNEFPPDPDLDGDGIPDPFDDCPTLAEDIDGVRDGDGCPEGSADIDGDFIIDTSDNCVDTYNTPQLDTDNDGRGDACDCAFDDPTAWDQPLEIEDLTWPSKFEMNWSPTGDAGTVYEIIRSTLDDFPVTADGSDICLVGNLLGTSYQDVDVPQAGGYGYNVRGRNACGVSPLGGGRGTAADCSTQSCGHSKCDAGVNLFAGCDTCVAQICAADSYCCNTAWDSICVGRVLSDCGLATCADNGSNCVHDVCTAGPALVTGCDVGGLDCVTSVCDQDPYCCDKEWDDLCRLTVEATCGATCE